MNTEKILDISWGTIFKIGITALVVYVLFLTRGILVWVLFGVIISVLFDPAIDFLQRRRIPRFVGTFALYLAVFGVIAFIIYSAAPIFINEIERFSQLFPRYFETVSPIFRGLGVVAFSDIQSFIEAASGGVEQIASNVFSALFSIFGGIFATFFVLSIAIFLSLDDNGIERAISVFFSKKHEAFALDLWARSQKKVSAWFASKLLTSIFVGVASFVVLLLFNTKYPLSLGMISGVLNFIPIVGPLIGGALVMMMVALDSLMKAVFVGLAFVLIQQIENNILTPILTKKLIGLSPTVVLIALAVGGELWGMIGAILAVPIAGILFEFLRDFLKKRKEEAARVV